MTSAQINNRQFDENRNYLLNFKTVNEFLVWLKKADQQ
jgi:hypothetical protein